MRKLQVLSTLILTDKEYEHFISPCVYIFRCWEDCIYIGASARGILRVLDPQHPVRKVMKEAKLPITTTDIRWCASKKEAFDLELLLIQTLKPQFNRDTTSKMIRGLGATKEQIIDALSKLEDEENASS